MAFERPSISTLIKRSEADVEANLPGADARVRRSIIGVIVRVVAGALHGLYGYLDWISRQILPDTCDEDVLLRHAAIWLKSGRVEAKFASGTVLVTGTNGVPVPAETVFVRSDGARFISTAVATIYGSSALVSIDAESAGAAGNSDGGSVLSLETPIAGLNASATVSDAGLTGGADVESIDALRARVIEHIQEPPQGGAFSDYVAWVKEVIADARVWPSPGEMGDGTITVRFALSGDTVFPLPGDIAAVQAYLDEVRPVTVKGCYVVAPLPQPVNFSFSMIDRDTATVRAAVEAELADLLLREATPGGTIPISHIHASISAAAGERDYVLDSPSANVVCPTGFMATIGAVSWPS